jgi:hypothetical protein
MHCEPLEGEATGGSIRLSYRVRELTGWIKNLGKIDSAVYTFADDLPSAELAAIEPTLFSSGGVCLRLRHALKA